MGEIIGTIGYKITINYNSHGKQQTLCFSNIGKIGYAVDINVSKNSSQGTHTADITFYNLKDDITRFLFRTENTFGKSGTIEIVANRGMHTGKIFKGEIVRAIPDGFPETTFTINATCGNFFNELFVISATNKQTRHDLKQLFASQMGYTLQDYIEEDKIIKLTSNFYYQGRSPLRRLQVFFQNQNVYIDGNSLCFLPKEDLSAVAGRNAVIRSLSEEYGLIGTISVNDATSINAKNIFLPDLMLGQKIKLNCVFPNNARYNGDWFINGLQHSISIKNTITATTDISLASTNFSL